MDDREFHLASLRDRMTDFERVRACSAAVDRDEKPPQFHETGILCEARRDKPRVIPLGSRAQLRLDRRCARGRRMLVAVFWHGQSDGVRHRCS
jgi:hypothetical protein